MSSHIRKLVIIENDIHFVIFWDKRLYSLPEIRKNLRTLMNKYTEEQKQLKLDTYGNGL